MDFLVRKEDGKEFRIPVKIFEEVSQLKALLNESAWQILKLLSKQHSYPAEIAKKLNLHEQKVYYYIKQLKQAGLIEVVKTEERQGALAKYFKTSFESIALVPEIKVVGKKTEFSSAPTKAKEVSPALKEFFEPFIREGKFNARIVVGSPDPHSEFKGRARDAHLAVELAMFLGSMCEEINFPLVLLDTMISSLREENSNLIIVGGPLTNKLAHEINEKLSIRFSPSGGHWVIKSSCSDKEYSEDSIGVIEKLSHPNFVDKKILLIAGKRNAGTKAAIVALIKHAEEITKGNNSNESVQAKVVEGLDLDGDGVIDNVEIKE